MNVEQLTEVQIIAPPVELPPCPRFGALYVVQDGRYPDLAGRSWSFNATPLPTAEAAFAEAMFQGRGFETIESSVRIFEMPDRVNDRTAT
jgi:hypothetical protein